MRSPAQQAHKEAISLVQSLELVVGLWEIVHEEELLTGLSEHAEAWLDIANALWRAARIVEELGFKESQAMLEDMSQLAEIRAEMEVTT